MEEREIVKVLNECEGIGKLKDITPEGFCIEIDRHSTATHCHIYLELPEEESLLVWYKTNWCSSSYEFNENGKVIGLQSNCGFIEGKLNNIFTNAKKEVQEYKTSKEVSKQQEVYYKKEKKNNLLQKYKKIYA